MFKQGSKNAATSHVADETCDKLLLFIQTHDLKKKKNSPWTKARVTMIAARVSNSKLRERIKSIIGTGDHDARRRRRSLRLCASGRPRPVNQQLSAPQPLDACSLAAGAPSAASIKQRAPPLPRAQGHMGGSNSSDHTEKQKSNLIGLERSGKVN